MFSSQVVVALKELPPYYFTHHNDRSMPCLAVLLSLAFPRLMLVLLWLFSDWFDAAYDGILYPLLGLLFAPLTCIWYAMVMHYFDGAWTAGPIVGMVVAVAIDFGLLGKSAKDRR